MSSSAEKLIEIIRELPESKLAEILDFAEFVKTKETTENEDFFSMAGLWEGRDIDQESLRKQAWPQRTILQEQPGGLPAISRGLSVAIPPNRTGVRCRPRRGRSELYQRDF
jgi:hypothetical protein